MATLNIPYSFANNTVANANFVNDNFDAVKNFVETSVIQVDGSVQLSTAAIADFAVTSAKIANDSIVNADINSAAGIVDTKLATIATAGKVSNSATTATNTNTANAIVARDASGNFSAGTITASLSGNVTGSVTGTASGNLVSGGALGTPSSGNLTNCTFPTLNQNTTGNAATAGNATTAGRAAVADDSDRLNGYASDITGQANLIMRTDGNGVAAALKYGAGSTNTFNNFSTYSGTILFRANVAANIYNQSITTSPRTMLCNSDGTMGTSSSSIRFKENLRPYVDPTNKILEIQPYVFDYKLETQEEDCSNLDGRLNQFGMIAEHLHDAGLNHLVHYGPEGRIDSINYMMLSVELLGVIKNQQAVLNDLITRVGALENN
jgi:hypothetical protein